MARYYGKIGFVITKEDPNDPGVYVEEITERNYRGNVNRESYHYDEEYSALSGDFKISNQMSFVADGFALTNLGHIRYVEFLGTRWNVTNAEVARPRIILTLGGVYNGPEA